MYFNFLPVAQGVTVNTSNVHGTSQTQLGMPVILGAGSPFRTAQELALLPLTLLSTV